MSLTLGLNTALSGLLTAQRGLDVISQNVVNVNTKGYVRKVMNPESRIVSGTGAGVQDGGVTRMVNQGLLKDIRRQLTNTGRLEVEQSYYPRLDDLFGEVSDESSIAHKINDLFSSFESLSGEVSKPASQWATMQSAQDVADLTSSMTNELQSLRLQADRDIESTVTEINDLLNNIHDLNQKIVKNSAIASGTSDLEDKRDMALNDLSKLLDVQYYYRSDNSVTIFSNSGQMLLDNQPQPLSYSASSVTDTWMTAASGEFGQISIRGGSIDFGPEVTGGKLKALLDLRDTTIPNLQANLDEMSAQMRDAVNLVHNRGTSYPNVAYSYQGTRTFAKQGNIVPTTTETTASFYTGTTSIATGTGGAGGSGYGTLSIAASTTNPWQATISSSLAAASGPFSNTTYAPGQTFSISGSADSRNDGTYRVVGYTDASHITVEKVNVRQTMQLGDSSDVALVLFDSSGNQLQSATLNDIMQLDYTVAPNAPTPAYTSATTGSGRSLMDFQAKGDHESWAIDEVSAHMEAWLRKQGYNNASVNLDSEGKMAINLGDTSVSLAFRDQVGSTAGADAADATIKFDVNGDGTGDQTVQGFSNFFGLNDLYVNESEAFIMDSNVLASGYTISSNRDLQLYDTTGKLGNSMSFAKGTSLQQIADSINAQSRTTESVELSATSWTLTSDAVVTVADSSGALYSVTLSGSPPTSHSLAEIAGKLTQGTVTASVVQDGAGSRLRLVDARGYPLTVSISGGTLSSSPLSLGQTLDMTQTQRVEASVVPEGSGYRLRLRQTTGDTLYMVSTEDGKGQNLMSDLGLQRAATGAAGDLGVRTDIRTAPEKMSRGSVQWNADTQKYYLSEGDNSTTLELANALNSKVSMHTAGSIYAGQYSLAEYAASTIAVVSQASNTSTTQMDYQTSLNASLDFQNTSYSGVNLDEEISSMMDYQQAYSAAAKVITTLQDMLETLTSMIR